MLCDVLAVRTSKLPTPCHTALEWWPSKHRLQSSLHRNCYSLHSPNCLSDSFAFWQLSDWPPVLFDEKILKLFEYLSTWRFPKLQLPNRQRLIFSALGPQQDRLPDNSARSWGQQKVGKGTCKGSQNFTQNDIKFSPCVCFSLVCKISNGWLRPPWHRSRLGRRVQGRVEPPPAPPPNVTLSPVVVVLQGQVSIASEEWSVEETFQSGKEHQKDWDHQEQGRLWGGERFGIKNRDASIRTCGKWYVFWHFFVDFTQVLRFDFDTLLLFNPSFLFIRFARLEVVKTSLSMISWRDEWEDWDVVRETPLERTTHNWGILYDHFSGGDVWEQAEH